MSTTYGLHRAVLLNRNGVATMFEDQAKDLGRTGPTGSRGSRARLQALGVGKGDRVAVLSLNQDRYIELYLGVAWAGAVIVPLNIRWSAPENEDALRDSRPKVLVVDAAFSGMGAALARNRSDRSGSSMPTMRPPRCRTAPRTTRRSSRRPLRSPTPKRPKRISPASSTPAERPGVPKA